MTCEDRRRPFERLLAALPEDRIEVLILANIAGFEIGDLMGEGEAARFEKRSWIFFEVFGDRRSLARRPSLEVAQRVFADDPRKVALCRRLLGSGHVVPLHREEP